MKIVCYRINPPRTEDTGFYLDYSANCLAADASFGGGFSILFTGNETVSEANQMIVDASIYFSVSNGMACLPSDVWYDGISGI
jgi:hypothetical protein